MNKRSLFSILLVLVIIISITLLWYKYELQNSVIMNNRRDDSLIRVSNITNNESSEYNSTETPKTCSTTHDPFIKLNILNSNVSTEIQYCKNTLNIYMNGSREAHLSIEITVVNLQSLTTSRVYEDVIAICNCTLDYRADLLFIVNNKYYKVVESKGICAEIMNVGDGKQFILKIVNLEDKYEPSIIMLHMSIQVRIHNVESGLEYMGIFMDYTLNIYR